MTGKLLVSIGSEIASKDAKQGVRIVRMESSSRDVVDLEAHEIDPLISDLQEAKRLLGLLAKNS